MRNKTRSKINTLFLWLTAWALLAVAGCACQRDTKRGFESLNKSEWQYGKDRLPVQVMADDAPLDITSVHITNVPYSLAEAKALQAMAHYDRAAAAKIGYDFPISTVWQPENLTEQVIDGHMYWVGLLGYHPGNQAAYDETKGVCPGLVVVDAEDESKPAEIKLTKPDGTPYKIEFHFRNVNFDHKYIYRFLFDDANYDVSDPNGFTSLGAQPNKYLDDVTLEVEDGTWNVYFTGTYNVCQQREGTAGAWRFPDVKEFFMVNGETKEIKKMKPEQAPAWVDRIYSEHLISELINAAFYNLDNWNKTSQKGRMVLDGNRLETVLDSGGKVLEYVGVMTSTFADDTGLGVIIVPTKTLKAKFYPRYGDQGLATHYHAEQVINQALHWRGYHVDDLTLHFLYNKATWEGALLMNVDFHEQDEEGQPQDSDHSQTGTTYAGCALITATDDVNVDDVVWDEGKQVAFDKYEHHVFNRQTSSVGSMTLEEHEGDGTLTTLREHAEHGDSMYTFTLNEPQYRGLIFRLAPGSTYDRESVDILGAQVGDHVVFKYGDNRTSPTCFVKNFRDVSRPAGGGALR